MVASTWSLPVRHTDWGLRDYGVNGQLGLERSPDAYVAKLVQVFREVRRVLRDDGSLWLNLGDSYASGKGSCFNPGGGESSYKDWRKECGVIPLQRLNKSEVIAAGMKPKDLVGIPWMVAFALRADGWYLRSDIIWHKPNPMPESVTDRPTKAHEYLFLLTKSARYFYDADAVREENSPTTGKWGKSVPSKTGTAQGNGHHGKSSFLSEEIPHDETIERYYTNGRNRRSVWTIATRPYSGAHFAVFPPALVEPCIKAGTSERGCCPKCGKPWMRVVERVEMDDPPGYNGSKFTNGKTVATHANTGNGKRGVSQSIGWQPACSCDPADPVPCTVLDPFAGSGTVGAVALELGRSFIGIELNPNYLDLIRERIGKVQIQMAIPL